ncbi:U2 snRNP complex subunit HSH49 SCDLUD_000736 [Saccharomycodes ludwigii]|nr:hypothetical protein SCDLUD_000736 [Saccharomycodes ludwigii]KAH3903124.1 hypothetical protein SCDLUD_000736 [Saccharomycodes ludwigii]
MLYELFQQFSIVTKIHYPIDKLTKSPQGYCFIQFSGKEDVKHVLNIFSNNSKGNNYNSTIQLYGKPLRVKQVVGIIPDGDLGNNNITNNMIQPNAIIVVENLDPTITVKHLKKIFSKFGQFYKDPIILSLNKNNASAMVHYRLFHMADNAINEMNNKLLSNKIISVEYAHKDDSKNARHGDEIERLLEQEAIKNGVLI